MGCSPNERIFYKENIAASASNRGGGDWSYYTVEIGIPDKPYNGNPVFDIFVPEIGEFTSDLVSLGEIRNIKEIIVQESLPIESTPHVGAWPKSAKKVFCGPFLAFVTEGDEILQIKIMHSGRFRLNGTEKWFSLPCTEGELVEIFGRPDRTYEWFRE